MPKYKCLNKKCKDYNVVKFVESTHIKIVKGRVVDFGARCDVCNRERITVKDDGYTTMMHGGKNIPI